eukprot:TRINITY_DN14615_c0_g1_i1.p1 TRINITY_DN14615_c0_g1~~TRINITY_DN14615_c0_g1_i1.p1  ORF type:complete len:293 (+),score=79.47 TRINITY_DN14615_c0_g1_i1:81-959(+)
MVCADSFHPDFNRSFLSHFFPGKPQLRPIRPVDRNLFCWSFANPIKTGTPYARVRAAAPMGSAPPPPGGLSPEGVIVHVSQDPSVLPRVLPPPPPLPGTYTPLLPSQPRALHGRNTLVLDLDETLLHSSFEPIAADHALNIPVEGAWHTVYVKLRPNLSEFLDRVSQLFEVVLLTASREVYASPVLDLVEQRRGRVHHRLYRDSCANLNGAFIKDLAYLGRPLPNVVIIDNSPVSYIFQPQNSLAISSWFSDPSDRELLSLLPVLERLARAPSVYALLRDHRSATGAAAGPN